MKYFLILNMVFLISCSSNPKKTTVQNKPEQAGKTDTIRQPPLVGNDSDEHGCKASAGYTWSILKNNCIRIFESAMRMSPQESVEDKTTAAFALFNADNTKAEIYIPGTEKSIILEMIGGNKKEWRKDEWRLKRDKKLVLLKNDVTQYAEE